MSKLSQHLLAAALAAGLLACAGEPTPPPQERIDAGEQLLADGRTAEAIALFQREIDARPSAAILHAWLARAYAADDQLLPAIDAYQRCLELDPEQLGARVSLAHTLFRLDRIPEAEAQLREVLARDATRGDALHLLGDIHARQGRYPEAIEAYHGALAAPRVGKVLMSAAASGLCESQLELGDLEAAEDACRRAVAADSSRADTHADLGLVLFREGRIADAVTHLERAVQLDSLHTQAHFNLGNAYLKLGRLEEGQRELTRYRELDDQERRIYGLEVELLKTPQKATLYHDLGVLHTQRGETAEAYRRYLQAVQRDTSFAPSYHNLGTILLRQGDLTGAMGLYRRALRADTTYVPAYRSLGNIYMRTQHVAEAVQTFRAGLRFEPDNEDLQRRLALARRALAHQGHP